ncbi:hypothetical protein M8J76_016456 [Diaphorina citri]|nr:hypothetical protein M8J76_016456 [Diaphorina citri]
MPIKYLIYYCEENQQNYQTFSLSPAQVHKVGGLRTQDCVSSCYPDLQKDVGIFCSAFNCTPGRNVSFFNTVQLFLINLIRNTRSYLSVAAMNSANT